jgi:hypothetical protein
MSVIILEKDPFVDAIATAAEEIGFQNENVRRPLYGVSIKSPRFAFLSVRQADYEGNLVPISMKDSSAPGGTSNANHNFILQKVEYQRVERAQIVETFGDHFVFFYGEKPVILQCSGFLLNTRDFNWKNEWLYNYDQYLRGTRAVESRSRVYLGFDDVLLEGYLLATGISADEGLPYVCPFQFQILATNHIDLSEYEEPVTEADQARKLEGQDTLVEYLTEVVGHDKYVVNATTGISEHDSGGSGDAPASITDSGMNSRTAFWVSDIDPPFQQWKTEDEALVSLSVELAAQEAGSDPVTARQAMRSDPFSFPLGSRSDTVAGVGSSLGTGVANGAAVIDDAPTLE